ncbi:MAG: hypothetical protein P8Y63_02095, partial [Deltaproteobacteria bacterium]
MMSFAAAIIWESNIWIARRINPTKKKGRLLPFTAVDPDIRFPDNSCGETHHGRAHSLINTGHRR